MATVLQLAQMEAIIIDQVEEMEGIQLARDYFNGNQEVELTNGTLDFLGIHDKNKFRANICRTIVTALAEELNLLGFDTSEPISEDGKRPLKEWVDKLYKENKLDSLQDPVHEGALSDSESFILVEWDGETEAPRLIHHNRFIDTDSGGDGDGIYFLYENDDPRQRPRAAVKEWIETFLVNGAPESRRRRTIYFPDRIERFVNSGGEWLRLIDPETESNVVIWTRNGLSDGEPIGIPVFHFMNKGKRPEHWEAIPIQDGINKTYVDCLAAGDLTAFQSFFGFGFYPTTDGQAPKEDGSNLMSMGPAQFNGTNKPAGDASLQVIPGQDPTPLWEALKNQILMAAQLTETPASRFVTSGQIAAADTLQTQDKQLKKKASDRRGLFSDPWIGAVDMARKLSNIFGSAALDETIAFSALWENVESLDDITKKKEALGIPIEQVWREAGYSDQDIEKMKSESSYRVAFERSLWEGYNAASLSGISIRLYLERVGLSEKEIKKIDDEIGETASVIFDNNFKPDSSSNTETAPSDTQNKKTGDVPSNLQTDKGLNGAQITAAVDLLSGVSAGTVAPEVAVELLISLGLDEPRARRMVAASQKVKIPTEKPGIK